MPRRNFRVGRSTTGLGLFAVRAIKKRGYIVAYRGRLITNEESARREAKGAKFMFEVNRHMTIDGSSRRNLGRYLNHSCRPNAEPMLRRPHGIYFRALRAIAPGEEITIDYGEEYFDLFIEPNGCRCAACGRKAAKRRKR